MADDESQDGYCGADPASARKILDASSMAGSWYCEPCAVEVRERRCPHCGKLKGDRHCATASSGEVRDIEDGAEIIFLDGDGEQHRIVYDICEDRPGVGSGWFLHDEDSFAALKSSLPVATSNAEPADHGTDESRLTPHGADPETVGDDRESMGSGPAKGIVTGGSDPAISFVAVQPVAWRWRIKDSEGYACEWVFSGEPPNITKEVLHDCDPLYAASDVAAQPVGEK